MPDPRDSNDGPLVHYPFPLRPDCMVFFYFPPDLTRADVARIVAFLETLAKQGDANHVE